MSFTFLTPLAVTAGILGLAGVLYLLQRLRVRHRELDVVTTLFWREAVQETRARVLVRRFRHPLAYLLILFSASLLWLAFAGPKRGAEAARQFVCLLDASAGMGHGNRFEQAKARLIEVVDELPAEGRQVLCCGESVRTLLAPGEETLLLEARLEGLAPRPAPASLRPAIERLVETVGEETTILVFGDAPLDQLPSTFGVQRVATGDDEREENRGITALGVSPAASGAWDVVDVLVELTGDKLETRGEVSVRLDGEAVALSAETIRSSERARALLFRDVPARGQRFEVTLEVSLGGGDGFGLDDRAVILLPDRPLLRVGLATTLDEVLRPVLEADPAVVLVDEDADVMIARGEETIPAGLPALRFVPAEQQTESFLVTFADEERSADEVLFDVVGALGLEEIDSTGLAEAAERPITLGARAGTAREVAVWEELIGAGFDFVDSRSFPLFVARSLRWLKESGELRSWAVAGEALPMTAAFEGEDGTRLDPVGASFTPPVAGNYTAESGERVAVSLCSVEATEARPLEGIADPADGVDGGSLDPVTWLLLLAGVLLLVEWVLVRTGRMP